jgi:hypothetical protein
VSVLPRLSLSGGNSQQLRGPHFQPREQIRPVDFGLSDDDFFPNIAGADENVHPPLFRIENPVLTNADSQVFFALLDVVTILTARADDFDDDMRNPASPDFRSPTSGSR